MNAIEQLIEKIERADDAWFYADEIDAARFALQSMQGEAVGWQFYQDGKWHNGMETNNHKQNTINAGYRVRDLFTSPPAQPKVPDEINLIGFPTSQQIDYADGWNACREALLSAQENNN